MAPDQARASVTGDDTAHELRRRAALDSYAVLDTPREAEFDDIAAMAAQACDAPIAYVGFLDAHRQWFKAEVGYGVRELSRATAICADTLDAEDMLLVPDLQKHNRYAENELVTGPFGLRFYGGVPLRTQENLAIGTLCVLDRVPRELTAQQIFILRALARTVMAQLEMRKAIVAQRQAETLVHASASFHRQILDSAVDHAVVAMDRAGHITQWSEGARRILGWDETEMLGKTGMRILPPEDRVDDRAGREMRTALAEGHTGDERWLLRKDGTRFWALAEMAPLRGEDGAHLGFVKVLRDRTEPRRAGLALKETQGRLRRAQEAGGIGVFSLDIADDLLTPSPECCRLFGMPEAAAYPASVFEGLVLPADLARLQIIPGEPRRSAAGDVEYRIRRADTGEIRWLARRGEFEVDAEGRPARFVGVVRDVTEQRRTRDALVAAEERQRVAVDATGIGIFDYDPVTNTLTWDDRVRALFGVAPDVPITWDACFVAGVHPDDWPAVETAVRDALNPQGDGLYDIAYRVRPLSGDPERWVAARGQCFFEDGRTVRFIGTARDITAQKVGELDLAATQERYRLALRATNDAIWDWDCGRDHMVWNEALTVVYGYDLASVAPTSLWWLDHIHPLDRGRVADSVRHVVEGEGETWTQTYRFRRADGRYADVIDRGYLLRDGGGRVIRMVGAMLEVTDINVAQRHQAALIGLGDRVRDATDPEEIAFVTCKLLGTTLAAGRVGYGLVDVVAETILIERDWCAPGVTSLPETLAFRSYGSYIDELKRGLTVVVDDAEVDPRTKAQSTALVGIEARAFVNMPLVERGRFVALLFVTDAEARVWSDAELALIREVANRTRVATERVRLEAEQRLQAMTLAELNAALAQQVESRTLERDRVWSSTNDLMGTAGLDGFLKTVNPAWTRMLGWTETELLAKPFVDLIDPADHAATADIVARLQAQETIRDFVDRIIDTSGRYRTIMWSATPDGDVFHIVGRDITALRQTEDALRQSQKMEAVGQLTGGIAHDFNNLLTGITGSLEMLTVRVAQGRLGDIDRYTTAAQGAAKRAAALTHRLLAFSRRQTLDPKPTDVNRLVAGLEELVRRTVGPAIRIEVVAAIGLWRTLIDPPQLENALLNLCINARDAMPGGGRITIETANKWLDARAAQERNLDPGQYISLCVSDTGAGMTQDVIEKAFDPFFTTKPLGQGTGLGLSMIYGFVRQSGGQVRIYSEIGEGTNVCLYLPRYLGVDESSEPLPAAAIRPRARDGETVLVVDDEPTVRMLVTEVLEELGYDAIEAADGSSGLKVLQSDVRIDLVVTDVGLPGGMNGRQMIDAARVQRPKLKVLFITGYAENAVIGNGLLAHGMHVMTKPFEMEALATRIKELIAET